MSEQTPRAGTLLVEGVVIVLSILLAFGIDAWWDGVQESRRRAALVEGLVSDFETTRSRLATATADGDALLERNIAFLSLHGETELPPLDSVQYLAEGAMLPVNFEPTLANYTAAVQSGDMGLLGDRELYEALAAFERAQEWIDLHWETAAFHFYRGGIQSLRDRVGSLGPVALGWGEECRSWTERVTRVICAYPEEWILTAEEVVALLDDPAVYGGFETAGTITANTLAGLDQMEIAVDRVLAALRALE